MNLFIDNYLLILLILLKIL